MILFRSFVISVALAVVIGWSTPAVSMNFDQVCALDTTVNCWGFEQETDMHYNWDRADAACDNDPFLSSHPNGRAKLPFTTATAKPARDGTCIYPKRDSTHASSGNHSLKFIYYQPTGSNPSGNFQAVFKHFGNDPYTYAQFGKGGEFWVRFRMRQSQGLLDFYGTTPEGKKVAIKRMIIHGYSSSSSLEETLGDEVTGNKIMDMYSDSGNEHYGKQDIIGCTSKLKKDNYPSPPCRHMVAEQWRTYQIHVRVADNASMDNGLIELYLDDEPSPIIRATDASMQTQSSRPMNPLPYDENAVWDGPGQTNGYGKLTFTLFNTGKDDTNIPPTEAAMWIDDVVISKVRVPPLDGTSSIDTTAPAAPTDVISQ